MMQTWVFWIDMGGWKLRFEAKGSMYAVTDGAKSLAKQLGGTFHYEIEEA